jgi:hypothetical protein
VPFQECSKLQKKKIWCIGNEINGCNFADVGYDGLLPEELGFVNNVINKYFTEYFTRSINTSATLRELGYYEKQVYTTHPWLVWLYLHCPPDLILSGIKLQVISYSILWSDSIYTPSPTPNLILSGIKLQVSLYLILWSDRIHTAPSNLQILIFWLCCKFHLVHQVISSYLYFKLLSKFFIANWYIDWHFDLY